MEKQDLLDKLKLLEQSGDYEAAHFDADRMLLQYINDPDISEAFKSVPKWYA